MRRCCAALLALALMAASGAAFPGGTRAHPHVFLDCSLTFVFDEAGLAGLRQRWVLDEMFAAMIMDEHDANGDGEVQPAEEASIKKGAFDNLKNFDYFTLIEVDGNIRKPQAAADFSASMQDGKLVYEFTLPCRVEAGSQARKVRVAVRDPDYYADAAFAAGSPAREGGRGIQVELDLAEVPAWAYYGGQIIPEAALCVFRRAP